jgi:hypothetical protein
MARDGCRFQERKKARGREKSRVSVWLAEKQDWIATPDVVIDDQDGH